MLSIRKALITSCSLALMAGWTAYNQPASAAGLGEEETTEVEEIKTYPRIEGEVSIEFQSDHTFKSDDPDGEVSDTYNTTETAIGVFFNPYFSVHSTLIFEPVLDLGPSEDRVFEDHGGYVSDLYAQLEIKGVRIYVGKYAPTFGKAWDITPGLYGTDFAEDYELSELLGGGVSIARTTTSLGKLELSGNVFMVDTSSLSQSVFTNRGQTRKADGGLANTEDLSSFSVTLDGSDIPGLPGISTHFGYRHLAKGATETDDENGFAFAISGEHKSSQGVGFNWIGEIVYLNNADGGDDKLFYATLGGQITYDRYNAALGFTHRSRDVAGGPDVEDLLFQASVGAEIHKGWSVDVGYKYAEESDVESHTIGVLVAKTFEFEFSKKPSYK